MHSLTLYIPGLLVPARDIIEQDLPATPALEKLLACSKREQLVSFGFTDAVCMLFRLQKNNDRDYPLAAISRVVDDDHTVDGIWMRADPVHLAADQKGLVLMDNSTFTLDQHDALVLVGDIRSIFVDHGMILEAPTTTRWYVRLEAYPAITTTPVHEVIGQDIRSFLPAGKDQSVWANLTNDIQMTLHNSHINVRREQQQERIVNSLWFWGCGELPQVKNCPWSRVFSDEEISRGFSILAGIPYKELPESLNDVIENSNNEDDVLIVMSFGMRHRQYQDINGWRDFISYLEQFWFVDALEYIKANDIGELTVLTEHQQFTVTKSSLYKFWKQSRPVSAYAG
jgi:hypothetical protein